MAEWTPERAQEITWVPKEQIIEATRVYGRTRPSCIHTRLGVDGQSLNSTQICRAITCMFSIKGDLDSVGGNLLHTPGDIPTAAALGPRSGGRLFIGADSGIALWFAHVRAGGCEHTLCDHPIHHRVVFLHGDFAHADGSFSTFGLELRAVWEITL